MAKIPEQDSMLQNQIGSGTKIKGDIDTNGDIKIDGTVEGNLVSKGRVLIGQNGVVKGDVKCANCDIYGNFDGKIEIAELLSLKASSKLTGDVKTGKLSIEPGAIFTGTCDMGGNSSASVSVKTDAKK
ncbi:bactofilin family protein [Carboxylicivirga caseinilyticus]|uniref:bactofilin family protein n=1 Tax=Carboxylicivirga caseinilyticus TaxID=3417572 RepID=UPI003D325EA0|nr:polymer-forming cytoskeletal protein [Marinilabiliaceae bacterium A049]